jgi:hypothetical protein
MILLTVPGIVVLGCSRIRAKSLDSGPLFLPDVAMRRFAIFLGDLNKHGVPGFFLSLLMQHGPMMASTPKQCCSI